MYQVLAMQGDFPLPSQPFWGEEFETPDAACEAARQTFAELDRKEICPADEMVVFVYNPVADETCEDPCAVVVAGMLFKRSTKDLRLGGE